MADGVATQIDRELAGLRALARCLVSRVDADDLVQDAAVAAIAHRADRPAVDDERPLRPWLAAILRNRWRMDRRAQSRRIAREQAIAVDAGGDAASDDPATALDRARALERLATALVALAEPYRDVVIRRYFDGQSSAEIARALGAPAATIRGQLKIGIDRLRADLDAHRPRWRRAVAPLALGGGATGTGALAKGALIVSVKSKLAAVVAAVVIVLAAVGVWFWKGRDRAPEPAPAIAAAHAQPVPAVKLAPTRPSPATAPKLAPSQTRATQLASTAPGGIVRGRVINWSSGDGVVGAELAFASDAGVVTVRTGDAGAFELAPSAPGRLSLAAASAPGFLP